MTPTLSIVAPCYNEEDALPVTSGTFLAKIRSLIAAGSRIIFVDDGSSDSTWQIITELSKTDGAYTGIRLSRNHGHQNAVLAGLMEAKDCSDITITIDCDGQDDIDAMDRMIDEYRSGAEIVYGVRSSRGTDSFFKRFTAESFYRVMRALGAETVFNHADYRLVSSKVLRAFADFSEVNLFLRGMFPLVGFRSTCVYYERRSRIAGESHYPLRKMLHLAFDGITSLSVKPLHIIIALGCLVAFVSFVAVVWSVAVRPPGQERLGLGEHGQHRLLHWRNPARVHRRDRRVRGQDLHGGEAQAALHHQRADGRGVQSNTERRGFLENRMMNKVIIGDIL